MLEVQRRLEEDLYLTRFDDNKTFMDIVDMINNLDYISENNWYVKEYDEKSYYDNDFQDYELMVVIGNDNDDVIDLTIYYAKTRIGGGIVVEVATELM